MVGLGGTWVGGVGEWAGWVGIGWVVAVIGVGSKVKETVSLT